MILLASLMAELKAGGSGYGLWIAAALALAIMAGFTVPFHSEDRLRIFVIDGSASFGRGHRQLKASLQEACQDLTDSDRVALIVFGDRARVAISPCRPRAFDFQAIDWSAGGGSCLESGLER